ncbi:MAG: prolipoprotein diacylglyceryl transferase [Pseudomonadota bacterium]
MLAAALQALAIPFPDIDPALFTVPGFSLFGLEIGPFSLRWYALSYLAGLLLGAWWIARLMKRPALWPGSEAPMPAARIEDLLFYMVIGVVAGGRIGYVLFYQPQMLIEDPFSVFAVWQGGMAFHGGMLGVILAVVLFSRAHGVPMLQLGDAVACATPFGLLFGRLANFINAELWGRLTEQPWGMVFPTVRPLAENLLRSPDLEYRQFGAEILATADLPRHPSQLYEAASEGLLLFAILAWLAYRTDALKRPGLCTGVFLIGYGLARGICEFFRQPDVVKNLELFGQEVTRGQLLCIPMILAGLVFVWIARREGAGTPAPSAP